MGQSAHLRLAACPHRLQRRAIHSTLYLQAPVSSLLLGGRDGAPGQVTRPAPTPGTLCHACAHMRQTCTHLSRDLVAADVVPRVQGCSDASRRDETNVWNLALWREQWQPGLAALVSPLGMTVSGLVQQQEGPFHWALGGLQGAPTPAKPRSLASLCCALVLNMSPKPSGPGWLPLRGTGLINACLLSA